MRSVLSLSAPRVGAFSLLLALLSFAARADAEPDDKPAAPPAKDESGPSIEIAPEHDQPAPSEKPAISLGAGSADDHELVRGMTAQRFRSAAESSSSTSIGGYGEIQARGTTQGRDGAREWVADIPRLVVFVAHEFSESFRSYVEIEVEHSLSCPTCPGAVELEQAYIDW